MPPVCFIQQNFTVGDISGNARRIADAVIAHHSADSANAPVFLTPELALLGYPAEDLLYSPAAREAVNRALPALAASLPPAAAVVVGTPLWQDGQHGAHTCYNAAALLRGGRVEAFYKKSHLPNFSVFDEKRYFTEHDNPPLSFTAGGVHYLVQICQDIWCAQQLPRIAAAAQANAPANAQAVLVLNGSPFTAGKQARRHQVAAECARRAQAAVYYANTVGAQDELVFDGASFAISPDGALFGQLPAFTEINAVVPPPAAAAGGGAGLPPISDYPDEQAAVYQALVCGIREYFNKSGFAKGALLGLSGGVDSALVAALAADALGAQNLCAVMLPTVYTSAASLSDAAQLAQNLGVEYLTIPLAPALAAAEKSLQPHFISREKSAAADVTLENLQARLRGTLLMALANQRDLLLLATGNKSEIACGYATLYGDMNGGFAPIKDVLKTQVWQLARYYNTHIAAAKGAKHAKGEVIPSRIITRPPSAELRPEQTDQDSLPPYETIDAMLRDVQMLRPPHDMARDYGREVTADFMRRLAASEYKRRQAPLGTKISDCAFGRDWRMPVANGRVNFNT